MSLDPMPDAATLLRMKAERERNAGYVQRADDPPAQPMTLTTYPPQPFTTVTLRIPWSALVSDNIKSRAALRGNQATIVLTPAYRDARDRIKGLCITAMDGRPSASNPVAVVARVWVPNTHRRDVKNFAKACEDAMIGVIYSDDAWVYDSRWIRAGIDIDAPRAEIVISPYVP